jgi:phosphatidylserine/phosphatidylglycerophosphate/cardiolipin synthase-like enzyme
MSNTDLDPILKKVQRAETTHIDSNVRIGISSLQWFLENDVATHPIHNQNDLQFKLCGEEGFAAIETDIRAATSTVDLVLWGFDPAMELVRMTPTTDPKVNGHQYWPRGTTFGDLLAAKAKQGVQVRMLLWYDTGVEEAMRGVLEMLLGNKADGAVKVSHAALARVMQGMSENAPDFPAVWQPMPGFGEALRKAPRSQLRNAQPTGKDVREAYARAWWNAALSGEIPNLEIRLRKAHPASIDKLKAKYLPSALSITEEAGISQVGTHHQKPILIDYHPGQGNYQGAAKAQAHTCGYVMGLNSVTSYWDTTQHLYNDPRRETAYDASAYWMKPWHIKPYRDYAIRVEGEALACLNNNFCEAWDTAAQTRLAFGKGALKALRAKVKPRPKGALPAQIVRTQPEHGDATILKAYTLASSNARNYIYIENQYVQLADWVKFVKGLREKLVDGYAQGKGPTEAQTPGLKLPATMAPLYLFVVMPQPERNEMVPSTYDTLAHLGQATTVRGYSKQLQNLREGRKDPLGSLEQAVLKDTLAATPSTSAVAAELDKLGIYTLSAMLMTYDYENQARKIRINKRDNRAQTWQAEQEARTSPTQRPADTVPGDHSSHNIQPPPYREIYIHSKLMLVDDCYLTLGSANLNKRSMVGDSELNISVAERLFTQGIRQKVWGNIAGTDLDGGDGSRTQTKEAFDKWIKRMANNTSDRKKSMSRIGPENDSFIHTFDDPRGAPMVRLA